MQYVSTRGEAPVLDFPDVLLNGLAGDGGLYLPEVWPRLDDRRIRGLAGLPYAEAAYRVMRPFVGGSIKDTALHDIMEAAYADFRHEAVAPMVQLGPNDWLLELFHGPTLAFKDVAMQALARLFDHVLEKRGRHITIVGATSGDTGSAAIEAFRGRANCDIFILHPKGRVSEVQRRQMTTVLDENVHNIAIDGSFDDCQALVKAMFADAAFRQDVGLAGVNSINWARVMAQVVYYFTAGVALGAPARPISFSVPTGNFGDIFAGYVAAQMGLPIGRLVIATNANDILKRTFESGRYDLGEVHASLSPSMDIQVSSNFERLLFEVYGRDASVVRRLMASLKQARGFEVDERELAILKTLFAAVRVDDDETIATIRDVYERTGEILDPHSAVGVAAGSEARGDGAVPMVHLATAHPAKFPDAVKKAIGIVPALPAHLADLFERDERLTELDNDLGAVESFIRAHSRALVD